MSNRLCAAILLLPLALASLACSRERTEAPADATAQAPAAAAAPAAPAPAPEPDRYPKQTFEGEEGARKFVQAFMRSRLRGNPPRARALMSPEALAQYNAGQGGLQLMPASGQEFTEWAFGSVEAADASAFEVQVQIQASPGGGGADSVFSETLFVGPGADFQGVQRPWVIRGAQRAALDPNQ